MGEGASLDDAGGMGDEGGPVMMPESVSSPSSPEGGVVFMSSVRGSKAAPAGGLGTGLASLDVYMQRAAEKRGDGGSPGGERASKPSIYGGFDSLSSNSIERVSGPGSDEDFWR